MCFFFISLVKQKKIMTKQQTIRNLMKLSGCSTQTEFAKRHDVLRQTVGKWLSGQRNISIGTLELIAKREGYELSVNYKLE